MQPTASAGELLPLNQCRKIFIQRDYSNGLMVRFHVQCPPELNGKIEPNLVEQMVHHINRKFDEAESVNSVTVCETLFSCATCYLSQLCFSGQYEKQLKSIARYIREQNERVFQPRGLWITDPVERGLRVIEITLLTEPAAQHRPNC